MKYLIFLSLFGFSIIAFGQKPKKAIKKLGSDPVIFIDSINVENSELQKYDPADIASVSVYKDTTAIKLVGPDGKDGVIYVQTKTFARNKYINYFKSKSPEYVQLSDSLHGDSSFQYILNGRILKANYEGDLALIDDKIFKDLKIIDSDTLKKKYNISDKTYGIIIKSDIPDDLYHGKKKF